MRLYYGEFGRAMEFDTFMLEDPEMENIEEMTFFNWSATLFKYQREIGCGC